MSPMQRILTDERTQGYGAAVLADHDGLAERRCCSGASGIYLRR
jgi:hypothetical protein